MKTRKTHAYLIWLSIVLPLAALIIIFLTLKHFGYGLTYQVTPSMSKGFYWVIPPKSIKRKDVVIFHAPKKIENFLLRVHWVPKSGLLMKTVMAVPGDQACKVGDAVWVNGHKIAHVEKFYQPNKILPQVKFCKTLSPKTYLLMSTKTAHSFDGRYFGPVNEKQIIGKAIKL